MGILTYISVRIPWVYLGGPHGYTDRNISVRITWVCLGGPAGHTDTYIIKP